MAFICYRKMKCDNCEYEKYDEEYDEYTCHLRKNKDTSKLKKKLEEILSSSNNYKQAEELILKLPNVRVEKVDDLLVVMMALLSDNKETIVYGYGVSKDMTLSPL